MPISIKATRLTLTEELRGYAMKKMAVLEKFVKGKEGVAALELAKSTNHHKKGDVFYAEINLNVNGKFFRATAEGETIEAAIDELKDEITRELRKEKTRRTETARRVESRTKRALRGE